MKSLEVKVAENLLKITISFFSTTILISSVLFGQAITVPKQGLSWMVFGSSIPLPDDLISKGSNKILS